jgi:hypothetical protein
MGEDAMNSVNCLPEGRAAKAVLSLIFFGSFVLYMAYAARPAAVPGQVDFPLAPKTKWTNHLHQEMGEGVHFGPLWSKFVKGTPWMFL